MCVCVCVCVCVSVYVYVFPSLLACKLAWLLLACLLACIAHKKFRVPKKHVIVATFRCKNMLNTDVSRLLATLLAFCLLACSHANKPQRVFRNFKGVIKQPCII